MSRPFQTGVLGRCLQRRTVRAGAFGANLALLALCLAATFASAENRVSEYDVKAAYLFNFGKFVRFVPTDAFVKRTEFDICVVGEDPFGQTLDELVANEKLEDKPVRVVRLKSAAEARGCAIAYMSASEGDRMESELQMLRGQQVLTVSDEQGFLEHGGMIQLVDVADHVRFAVNLDAVRQAQLSLSAELLRVAISVKGGLSPGGRP